MPLAVLVAVTSVTSSSWTCTWVPATQPLPVTPTLSPATMTVFVRVGGGGVVCAVAGPTCVATASTITEIANVAMPHRRRAAPVSHEHIAHELISSSGSAREQAPLPMRRDGTSCHHRRLDGPKPQREAHHPDRMIVAHRRLLGGAGGSTRASCPGCAAGASASCTRSDR